VWLALSHHRVSLSQEELDALFDKLDSEDKKQRPVPFIPYLTTKLHPYQEQVNDSRTHAVYCPTNHSPHTAMKTLRIVTFRGWHGATENGP
jgi:hypothetical protein